MFCVLPSKPVGFSHGSLDNLFPYFRGPDKRMFSAPAIADSGQPAFGERWFLAF